ncbi:hypothetical protein RRF57_005171 [Xylaria bambusicola]|uniref:Uncharacterized protein n=1 Tax=Xylaria bambusicola TaxID=326684 RepID=A0AAN7UQ24_9PEZI
MPFLSLAAVAARPAVPDLVALLPASDALAVEVAEGEEPRPFLVAGSESETEKLTLEILRSCLGIRSVVARLPCCPPCIDRLVVAIGYII